MKYVSVSPHIILQEVGRGLIDHAETEAEYSVRGTLSELFPYIFQASRRMSARAISRWLADGPQIKLSAVTIAKALKNPEKHWEEFADFIEPKARIVEDALEWQMEDFLYNEEAFRHHTADSKTSPRVSGDTQDEQLRSLDEYHSAVQFLNDYWFSLENSVRDNCYRFFHAKSEEPEE